MPPFSKLAFVYNSEKPGAAELAQELMEIARLAGGAKKLKISGDRKLPKDFFKDCDACCVIGGDGTLLGAVRGAAEADIPIIGVNQGSLGFLTTFSADEARAQFASLLEGDYRIARRALLDCKTGPRRTDVALNDVLVKDAKPSRIVRLEVYANDKLVTEYTCDGLIFSTPTGSTAYNLAAGGPIVHPQAEVIAMTPICPHTLSNRTIIFRNDVKLRVVNCTAGSRLLVAMDGQRNMVVTEGMPVEISVDARTLALAQRRDYSHYEVMRAKLKWSGGLTAKK
jgi:NAD+ kinase